MCYTAAVCCNQNVYYTNYTLSVYRWHFVIKIVFGYPSLPSKMTLLSIYSQYLRGLNVRSCRFRAAIRQ